MTNYFDRFPVELLHIIFQYLSNCDVIWSFSDISPYVNDVLTNYNWQRLNFQSISKQRFDFICNRLNLTKITSLTLSDDITTPGQVRLFFSRFDLQELVNLRSLTLLSITNDDIYPILWDLPKLKYLTSLITECRSSEPLLLGQILNQLKSLQTLSVSYGDIFDHNVALPLRNLKVLNAGICNFLELRRLQRIVPSLISLKISLQAHHQLKLVSNSDIWSSLERLSLTLSREATVTFTDIEPLLRRFQKLTHLTLNIRGLAHDLADGFRWETCSSITRLNKFNFIIELTEPLMNETESIDEIFRSFSTPFWLEIKKWYVAVTAYSIYTISCFDEQSFISPNSLPLTTSPNYHWFYSKTKHIKVDNDTSLVHLKDFHHLERLDLSEEQLLISIPNINQFAHLRRLIIRQNASNSILGDILAQNPQINYLTISLNNFNQLFPLENVHYLHIENTIKIVHRSQIKYLCRIFPSIKRLFISVNSPRLICHIINGFQNLGNVVLHLPRKRKSISEEWLIENTRLRDNKCSFTYRFETNRFLLWINNSVEATVDPKDEFEEYSNNFIEERSDKCSLQ